MNLSRRGFLNFSAEAVAAAPNVVAQPEAGREFRTATIGTDWWGKVIDRTAMKSVDGDIVAACDVDESIADEAVGEVQRGLGTTPKKYKDFRELLLREKPEIVFVDHFDSQAVAPSTACMERLQYAPLYTLQHCLARKKSYVGHDAAGGVVYQCPQPELKMEIPEEHHFVRADSIIELDSNSNRPELQMPVRLFATLLFAALLMGGQEVGRIPQGFVRILENDSLDGWYISPTNRHGKTQFWKVKDGTLTCGQDQPGQGGLLVTRKKYGDYEVYLEVNPDYGSDGGLFLRTNDEGQGYQVMIDYLDKGGIGGVFLANVKLPNTGGPLYKGGNGWDRVWKKGEWNSIHARIEGAAPRITVWVNAEKVTDSTETANYLPGGSVEGSIGLQVHMGKRWGEGKVHRYRNIAVKELR